jgi:hypothetical protein
MLEKGMTPPQIAATWERDLQVFLELRRKSLLYQ